MEPLRTAKGPKLPPAADVEPQIETIFRPGAGAGGATSAADAAHPIGTCVDR